MNTVQRSAANCPPLSWTGSVTSLFWKQKTDNLRAYVVILDLEYMHICDRQSITLCARQISVYEVLCPTLCLYLFFLLLCMYNMSMYICIGMLSTVGTGVLICCIIVLYLLYWIFFLSKKYSMWWLAKRETIISLFSCVNRSVFRI